MLNVVKPKLPMRLSEHTRIKLLPIARSVALIVAATKPAAILPLASAAVEMLPDIMRTLANVTMNVAVTSAVDRSGAELESD